MSTQQITLPINIELDKDQLRTSLRNSIIEKSTTDDFRGIIDFMTAILRYTSELVGLSYENFKLTVVSAWEHDETHVRHFSSVNGFCVPKQTIPRYEVRERDLYIIVQTLGLLVGDLIQYHVQSPIHHPLGE